MDKHRRGTVRIVGVDPGTHRVGYALIERDGVEIQLINAETMTIPSGRSAERLHTLEVLLRERLERDKPDAVCLEELFFAKNAKTALAVAEARGIILLTAGRLVRSIWEYTPLEVKMAITGYGRADKSQVRQMVQRTLPNAAMPKGDDAIDAIAIALTGLYSQRW